MPERAAAERAPEAPRGVPHGIERPFLMHCKSGADRWARLGALPARPWRPPRAGAAAAVLAQPPRRGARGRLLDHILDLYGARQAKGPVGIEDWLRDEYDEADATKSGAGSDRARASRRGLRSGSGAAGWRRTRVRSRSPRAHGGRGASLGLLAAAVQPMFDRCPRRRRGSARPVGLADARHLRRPAAASTGQQDRAARAAERKRGARCRGTCSRHMMALDGPFHATTRRATCWSGAGRRSGGGGSGRRS